MSFEGRETSQEFGKPFETFLFQVGGGESYRYTNADEPFGEGASAYEAIPISRENYQTTGKVSKNNLNLRLPVDIDLSRLYLDFPPPQEVLLTIRAHHVDDAESVVVWMGRVTSVSKEKNEAILTATNSLISIQRQGLRRNWQRGCPLLLYGLGCRADRVRATIDVEIVSVASNTLLLPFGWQGAWPKEKFAGGMIVWSSEFGTEARTIRSVSDTGIVFVGPLRGIEAGTTVQFVLGCQHNRDDCENVHDNIKNYGGQPWIPFDNPAKYANFW